MCLSIAVHFPDHVLATGVHSGHEWVVVRNTIGFRCGYVKVDPGHPWHGKGYDEPELEDVEIHGGLTFAEADLDCGKGEDNGWWLGFDAGHAGDAQDPQLATTIEVGVLSRGIVRDQPYMEAECRLLCEQAASAQS